MNKESCVIYQGNHFQIEWYFDANGFSQPYEYFLSATPDQRRTFLLLVKRIGDFGVIMDKTKFRNEGDGIFAFKPQPDRYLCFFTVGKKIIVTNSFVKRQQKLPQKEKKLCVKCQKDYLERFSE